MGKQRTAYTTSSCLRPMVTELHNENSVSIIVNSACFYSKHSEFGRGRSGGAKVSCSLRHRGVQLILDYNWARPATLVAGKGRGGCFYFFCFFTFIPVPLSSLSLSPSPLLSILSLFSLFLGDDTKWPTRVDVSLNPNSINQSEFGHFQLNLSEI